MIDYVSTLQKIDTHVTQLTDGLTKELTPDGFESTLKAALVETEKMMTRDQIVQLKAIREVVEVTKLLADSGSWSDNSSFRFPMLTGPMSVESMTAWSSMTRKVIEARSATPVTNFSDNLPVVKNDGKDPWGTGDFNREPKAS
jgi:hypothetical protein